MVALMDAAERLLVRDGHAGTTTRRVAAEAGLNHGLVHYYFGSMNELLLAVLERFTKRLVDRQRAMYAADVPFIDKWRTAMRLLEEDFAAGYPKVQYELQAIAWNRPELRQRYKRIDDAWRGVLTEAVTLALAEYDLDWPPDAVTTLVITFNLGLQLEMLSGIRTGHREMLAWIDGWLESLEAAQRG
jgi:AcrR family transcriptional regulator